MRGLTEAEVTERRAQGLGNAVAERSSRSVRDIVVANVATRFNALLGSLLVITLVVGPIRDAAFGLVLIANSSIGVVQELRAKRTLDRLAILTAPRARVVRDSRLREVGAAEVVRDDIVALGRGDQVLVDGVVLRAEGLEVDESMLTGEADPIVKPVGAVVLSGGVVVAGGGLIRATGVGENAYGHRIALEARRFRLVHSELRAGINRLLRWIGWSMPIVGTVLVLGQVRANADRVDALRASVAGLVTMVPEGLVLLSSLAFAVAVLRLARRRVVAQELAAVEALARVDVVCLDKTGTLTEGSPILVGIEVLDGQESLSDVPSILASLAAAEPRPTSSLEAVRRAVATASTVAALTVVPFSSARRWSGAVLEGLGAWVLGAPDALLDPGHSLISRTAEEATRGGRVLLLARAEEPLRSLRVPRLVAPVALVLLAERLRADASATIDFFHQQRVALKLISGDDPLTVAAVARRAGLADEPAPLPGSELPESRDQLAHVVEAHSVFGRVAPEQKRAMVEALRSRGHVVAMVGDGVNDVLALQASDIGVAIGSGSLAARSVARLVLLNGTFASLPAAVAEGRRVVANVERVAALFLTKTVCAVLLSLAVAGATLPFPLLTRQLTLVASVSIGIPAFFLALAPSADRARAGFVERAVRVAAIAGLIAALVTFAAYAAAVWLADVSLAQERTTATLALGGTGLALLAIVAAPVRHGRAVVGAMLGVLVGAFALPPTRWWFTLDVPSPAVCVVTAALVAAGAVALRLTVPHAPSETPGGVAPALLAIRSVDELRRTCGGVHEGRR